MKTSLNSKSAFHSIARTLTLVSLLSLSALVAKAADIFWTDGTASYTNAANWAGGVVPGSADNAINTNGTGNIVQINTGNPDWTVIDLSAGGTLNGAGAFEQNAQTVNVTVGCFWDRASMPLEFTH